MNKKWLVYDLPPDKLYFTVNKHKIAQCEFTIVQTINSQWTRDSIGS